MKNETKDASQDFKKFLALWYEERSKWQTQGWNGSVNCKNYVFGVLITFHKTADLWFECGCLGFCVVTFGSCGTFTRWLPL